MPPSRTLAGWRTVRLVAGIAIAAIPLLVVPAWPIPWIVEADVFLLSVASFAVITAIVATATGMFVHHSGLPTLAQAGLWGVGGYAAGIGAAELDIGFWPSLAFAALAPALVALPVAMVSFRTTGLAFLVVTLGFSEFIVLVLGNLEVGGSTAGLVAAVEPDALGPLTFADPVARYYLYCGFLVATLLACWAVGRSRFGARLNVVRDDEMLARSLGLSPFAHRLAAFELSAVMVGVAGALLLDQQRVITPDLFSSLRFIDIYLAMVLGGLAFTAGPAVGAWIVAFMPLWLGFDDRNTARLVYGALLVGVLLAAPRGLLGTLYPKRPRSGRGSPSAAGAAPPAPPRGTSGRPLLETHGLRRWFGANRALDGVDLSAREGEILGLIGPNGSGKTTLLNCVSGFLRPDAGHVLLSGERIDRRRADAIARAGLVRTFQQPRALPAFTALASCELVAELPGRWRGPRRHRDSAARASAILTQLGLDSVADTASSVLTHGQLRMLGVALALCRSPRVLLLDEPAAGLSAAEAEALRTAIASAAAGGTAVIVVEHDMSFLLPVCDRLAVLDGGRKIAEGDPDAVCADERVVMAYLGGSYARERISAGEERGGR